jgi:hypothetical protein
MSDTIKVPREDVDKTLEVLNWHIRLYPSDDGVKNVANALYAIIHGGSLEVGVPEDQGDAKMTPWEREESLHRQGWKDIESIPTDGMRVQLLTNSGSVTSLFANPEFKHEAAKHYTHWRVPPMERPAMGMDEAIETLKAVRDNENARKEDDPNFATVKREDLERLTKAEHILKQVYEQAYILSGDRVVIPEGAYDLVRNHCREWAVEASEVAMNGASEAVNDAIRRGMIKFDEDATEQQELTNEVAQAIYKVLKKEIGFEE